MIPLIAENILESLSNQLEAGFDSELKDKAEQRVKQGLYAMETLLGLSGFRASVKEDWTKKTKTDAYTFNRTGKEKTIQYILRGLFVCALLLILFSPLMHIPQYIPIIVAVALLVAERIYTISCKKKYQLQIDDWLHVEESKLTERDLYDFSKEAVCVSTDEYLRKICEVLSIDPDEAKVSLGRVKGGGSSYVGWGTAGAVGAGLALSAISKLRSADKNAKINARVREFETLIFYNNLAAYFVSEILPTIASNPLELLSDTLVTIET